MSALLIDFNQLVIAGIVQATIGRHGQALSIELARHIVLNSLRAARVKFKEKYPDTIICCDDRHYWRKQVYPYYKANRKHSADDGLDWEQLFDFLAQIKQELKDHFPYVVVQAENCEADDVIATLCKLFYANGKKDVLIYSSDTDFLQLQVFENVKQFCPRKKVYLTHPDPAQALREHIICGDSGDGVPNILSPDDVFVTPNRRQAMMTKQRLAKYLSTPLEQYDEVAKRGYYRNAALVDLVSAIPGEQYEKILYKYHNAVANKQEARLILNYLVQHKLMNLMSEIQDFT